MVYLKVDIPAAWLAAGPTTEDCGFPRHPPGSPDWIDPSRP